jgi:cytosine permease
MLPDYLAKAVPNPASNRAPWYKNIAPSYAGIFLWITFYNSIAAGTISHGTLAVCLLALAAAGLLSFALFYYIPAMLGMETGHPLYVVGSSTFGTRGGYLIPGLLMGVLQVGWLSVGTYFATKFLLSAVGVDAIPGTMPFILVGIAWGYAMAWIGVKGIKYVARVATFLNFIPLLMILIVFSKTASGISRHLPTEPDSFIAFTLLLQIVIGFFATAGAAGADFGTFSRNKRDVQWGGIIGILLAVIVAGGLPLLSVAGARVLMPNMTGFNYDDVVTAIGGPLSKVMFLLFTLACIPPACFSSFIVGNSFSTMIPRASRLGSTMAGMTIAIILAVTGAAGNLIVLFTIVGASFGPICGAMAADYVLSGRKWAGPRAGINWAGYGAWAVGLLLGILPFLPVSERLKQVSQPAALYSFLGGFAVYWLLAKAGLEPKTEAMASTR